jgi:hypothetical protein
MQGYLAAGDLAGLAGYVEANPDIMEADTPLAPVLADFLAAYRSGVAFTAFPPQVMAALEAALVQAGSTLQQATKTTSLY